MESPLIIENSAFIFNEKKVFFILDNKNQPWFKAKDVADILKYTNTREAIREHVPVNYRKRYQELMHYAKGEIKNIKNWSIFINEPGLYRLINKSKLPAALKFQDWVYDEVLPSIREIGEYKLKKDHENQVGKLNQEINNQSISIRNQMNKIQKMKEDIVPKTINALLRPTFVLLKTSATDDYPYYVIRCQKRSIQKSLARIKQMYPEYKILLEFEYDPNACNLYNRMKEQLTINLIFYGNHFCIKKPIDYSEKKLLRDINNLHENKNV